MHFQFNPDFQSIDFISQYLKKSLHYIQIKLQEISKKIIRFESLLDALNLTIELKLYA